MGTTLYYLNWGQEEDGTASELFHKYNVESVLDEEDKPPTGFTEEEFQELYRELISLPGDYTEDDLEQIWKEWQLTGFTEGETFQELRYCSQCGTYIEGIEESITHASQNHGYDHFEESGEPDYVKGVRSMSVGDVIEIDGTYYQAKAIGFEEITVGETV